MNVYDSERMTDALAGAGYAATDAPESADLILLNTCHIREKAAEKVYSELGRIRALKEAAAGEGRTVTVGVTGCVAQAEGAEIVRREPSVDLVVGPQSYHHLADLIGAARPGAPVIATEFDVAEKFRALDRIGALKHVGPPARQAGATRGKERANASDREATRGAERANASDREETRGAEGRGPDRDAKNSRPSAFLTVQEGCDKFCTFCVVPYTRGAEVSREAAAILAEAARLADQGVREVTLLGQNVNAWAADGPDGKPWGLGRLLFALAEIPGLDRLRYTTSHPRDMSDELIAAHRDLDCLMPYLHLPVQSGSDRMLAAMNRRHTRADYLRLVDKIRAARPDIALAGDFIVGFPGESDADFADTLAILDEAEYVAAFSFKYSPRPGTPAATRDDQVADEVKSERLLHLQAKIDARQRAFLAGKVGETVEVLLERRGRHPGQLVGRSPWLVPAHVDGDASLIGSIARVRVTGASANSLFGALAAPARSPAAAMELAV